MTADFLLELRSEEIPARMQAGARRDLARLFGEELAQAGIECGGVETYSTPRRLALIARGLPVGGDLEYADGVTIAQALSARREMR